ncbi:MAG: amidophosphoribosyltransferase, partial [Verrucomicrobiota bacterium]
LMTIFEVDAGQVSEVQPGTVVTIKADGSLATHPFAAAQPHKPCSFERIYFSRGNDPQIYQERKAMGAALVSQVVAAIQDDFDKTVFSFIPNTADTAYYGLMDGLRIYRREQVRDALLLAAQAGQLTPQTVDDLIMRNWPRGEKVANKDIKMRTFIAQDKSRDQMVSLVYDITYGVVQPGDKLVVLDDSIVRGTTLKKSILKILSRTHPAKIVICSTAPQIRYPDCYGIDMSELGRFIAFQAAVDLHKRAGRASLLEKIYQNCLAELQHPPAARGNCVKEVYAAFSDEEISAEISRLVYPEETDWKGQVEVIFQTIDNLHAAIHGDCGDWYFTGNYPTVGGFTMVNMAYIRWYEGISGRSYDLPL